MKDKKNIIWLSSYPKSGNTWIRIFLENIRSGSIHPADINRLSNSRIASSGALFDQYAGINSSDLTEEEIEKFRPSVYRFMAEEAEEDIVLKVHDAWRLNSNKEGIFPSEITKAVIYIIRNPLDIAVSSAFHNSISFKVSCERINSNQSLCDKKDRLYNQLRQELQSWSNHVISWIDQSGLPLLVVRYEDLLKDPFYYFKSIVDFLSWPHSGEEIIRSIQNSDIENLRKQEEDHGFREKPIDAERFFRSARPGNWKEYLNDDLVNSVFTMNRIVMERFGYSDKIGDIL